MIAVKWLLMVRGDGCSEHQIEGDGNNETREETDGPVMEADGFQLMQCLSILWKDDFSENK